MSSSICSYRQPENQATSRLPSKEAVDSSINKPASHTGLETNGGKLHFTCYPVSQALYKSDICQQDSKFKLQVMSFSQFAYKSLIQFTNHTGNMQHYKVCHTFVYKLGDKPFHSSECSQQFLFYYYFLFLITQCHYSAARK